MSTQERFELALKFIQTLPKDGPVKPSNMQLLSFYALKKQIDSGKCNTKAPSRMKMVDYAKWSAWNNLGNMSKEDAQKQYLSEIEKLDASWESKAKVSLKSKL